MGEETLNHENVLDQVLPLMFLENILHTWQCAVEGARKGRNKDWREAAYSWLCNHRPV